MKEELTWVTANTFRSSPGICWHPGCPLRPWSLGNVSHRTSEWLQEVTQAGTPWAIMEWSSFDEGWEQPGS